MLFCDQIEARDNREVYKIVRTTCPTRLLWPHGVE